VVGWVSNSNNNALLITRPRARCHFGERRWLGLRAPARFRRTKFFNALGECAGAPSAGTCTGAPRLLAFGRRAAVAQTRVVWCLTKTKRKSTSTSSVRIIIHSIIIRACHWVVGPSANPSWAGGWLTAPRSDVWIALVRDAHK